MTLSIARKLWMLTNGDILETGGEHAHIQREALVRQIFPGLSEVEQQRIFDDSLRDDVMRVLAKSMPHCGYAQREVLAKHVVKELKEEHKRQSAGQPKVTPPDDDVDIGGWEPY